MKRVLASVTLAAALLGGGSAAATPCRGDAPPVGSTVRGPVLHVLDGQTLCVALSPSPMDWAPLRLADAPPAGTRSLLMAVTFAQDVDCTVVEGEAAEAVAVCAIRGRRIGDLAKSPQAARRAKAWR